MILDVRVERNQFGGAMASKPAPTILGAVDDDAVDPGTEGGLPAETPDRSKYSEEDLLRQVEGLVMAAEKLIAERIHHLPMRHHELLARGGVCLGAASSQRRVVIPLGNVFPPQRAQRLHTTSPQLIDIENPKSSSRFMHLISCRGNVRNRGPGHKTRETARRMVSPAVG